MPQNQRDRSDAWWKKFGPVVDPFVPARPQPRPLPPPQPAPLPVWQICQPGDLLAVLHDGKPRNITGDPETNKSLEDRMFPANGPIDDNWRAALHLGCPGFDGPTFEHAYNYLTGGGLAFCNGNGLSSGHFKIENLICGGATRRAVTGNIERIAGHNWVKVYALDPKNLPTITTLAALDMTLYFLATIATRFPYGDSYRVDPFPGFNGRCIVPYIGVDGFNYIRAEKLLKVSEIVNPFYPERHDITWR